MQNLLSGSDSVLYIVGGLVLAGFFIVRQFTAQPLNPRRLAILPAIFAFLGLRDLSTLGALSAAAALYIGVELVLAAALGILRGATTRVWLRGGAVYTQGTLLTVGAWIASIVLRVAGGAFAHLVGIPFSPAEIFIFLAVTFGAQAVAIWVRAQTAAAPALAEAL